MNENIFTLALGMAIVAGLLVAGFIIGTLAERAHYRSIRRREEALRELMAFKLKAIPETLLPCRTQLVAGNVVVGMDYFKTFLAMLSNFIGGRIHSYESLIDRARREAVLRMKEEARGLGASCVLNVKFHTANIMNGVRNNKGAGCVEITVYGTAVIPV